MDLLTSRSTLDVQRLATKRVDRFRKTGEIYHLRGSVPISEHVPQRSIELGDYPAPYPETARRDRRDASTVASLSARSETGAPISVDGAVGWHTHREDGMRRVA